MKKSDIVIGKMYSNGKGRIRKVIDFGSQYKLYDAQECTEALRYEIVQDGSKKNPNGWTAIKHDYLCFCCMGKRGSQMRLNLKICFCTDGDFWFTNPNVLFDKTHSFYEGAEIHYRCTSLDQTIRFSLVAIGDSTACKRAAKDLLENLICNIRTSRYYIVDDLCKFLIPTHDVLDDVEKEFEYYDTISGNYEGTFLHLDVRLE